MSGISYKPTRILEKMNPLTSWLRSSVWGSSRITPTKEFTDVNPFRSESCQKLNQAYDVNVCNYTYIQSATLMTTRNI